MTERFETSQWVPYPVEMVFAFFASPSNLPHLMPPRLETRIEDARIQPPPARPMAGDPARRFKSVAAGKGSEILISFYPIPWAPKRLSWMARIVEFKWNRHFCDVQARGPFSAFRHRHSFQSETRDGREGTLVTDAIEFALPAWLGRVGCVLVQRKLSKVFAHRQKRLLEILAVVERQAAQRT
ncbi:MAG: SRPBCC family protein [Terracidiphilus sp.]